MELVIENTDIVFSPRYEHLEELILFVVQRIAHTLQSVSPTYVKFICSTSNLRVETEL